MKLIREIRDRAGALVFKRWELHRNGFFSVFLHGFYDERGDRDLHPHDHPWSFWGVCLWGGYEELVDDTEKRWTRAVGPGRIIHMPAAGKYHRILRLLGSRSYSLVFASRKTRPWGYWTEAGWIEAGEYRRLKNLGRLPRPKLEVVR